MKILHIASFKGNIGDNFNHFGLRELLENHLKRQIEWNEIEIRETFRGNYSFDVNFANFCNKHDAIIFGGGNFFELWVDKSVNNTSADIDYKVLDLIKKPFFFFGLGVDPGMGVTENGLHKFKKWCEYVYEKPNFHLSIRNDGAIKTLHKFFSKDFHSKFYHLVDGGFLVNTVSISKKIDKEKDKHKKYLGVNIAGDMLDIRFNKDLKYPDFIKLMSENLNSIMHKDPKLNLVLIPHIFRDLKPIHDILDHLADDLRRERVIVAELRQGNSGMFQTVSYYQKCDLILANRFHSNVIGLVLNIPTIGLFNYRQIKDLYEEINLSNNLFEIDTNSGLKKVFEYLNHFFSYSGENHEKLNRNYIQSKIDSTIKFFNLK